MLLYRGTALNNGNKSTHSPYDVFTVNKFSFLEHTKINKTFETGTMLKAF